MAVQTQIQTRRGTAATWTSTNPTLAAGEIGFESDTGKFKIGTGSTAWASLAYASNVSPLTTKGDLYTYSTDNTRLAVGNNGETIVADSSTSTGLRYQVPVNVNPILNSAFQIWQRGTSVAVPSSSYTYGADRWALGTAANETSTISRQTTSDTTNLPNIQYCARVQRNSGQTGTTAMYFAQGFESINSIPYAGKTVTLSYYARAGANYSSASNALRTYIVTGTGTDQNWLVSGYTGTAVPIDGTATLTTTWQRFTFTGTIASTATELTVATFFIPSGTAGTNDYFEITGVQLEVGSVATPFKTYAGTIQGELAACQRYYRKSYPQGTAPATNGIGAGLIVAATSASIANNDNYNSVNFSNPMRTAPTVTIYPYTTATNTARVSNGGGTDLAAGSGTVITTGDSGFYLKNGSGGAISSYSGVILFHYQAEAEL